MRCLLASVAALGTALGVWRGLSVTPGCYVWVRPPIEIYSGEEGHDKETGAGLKGIVGNPALQASAFCFALYL